jgi:hypothetical protein
VLVVAVVGVLEVVGMLAGVDAVEPAGSVTVLVTAVVTVLVTPG